MSELQSIRAALDEFRSLRKMGLGFKANTTIDSAIKQFEKRQTELVSKGEPAAPKNRTLAG